MKKSYSFICLAVLAASYVAGAQEIDPTVVVNRAYEGRLLEVHKPAFAMAVPDTVSRFDLDFDYSVFDKPYEGAYEFQPYALTMQPSAGARTPEQLYLKAGAGYTLHPLLDFVWSPTFKGPFRMDVYAGHRSYIGAYRSFKPENDASSSVVLDRWVRSGGDRAHWDGYDLETRAGVDGVYDWYAGTVDLDVAYHGIAVKDDRKTRMYDAVDIVLGVSSKSNGESYFQYDVRADYRFGEDKIKSSGGRLGEHLFGIDATVGQVIGKKHNVSFDVVMDMASYSHPVYATTAGEFSIVPHYVFSGVRWTVDAGLRMSKLLRSHTPEGVFSTTEQFVYPDVHAWFDVIPEFLRVYADIGGGNRLDTYSYLLERNHHFDVDYGCGIWPLMDATVERVSTSLGFVGRVGSVFSYDLKAGYVNYGNAPLDAVLVTRPSAGADAGYVLGMGYAAYQKLFAGLDMRLKTDCFKLDGSVMYTHAWGLEGSAGLFAPASLAGDAALEYNWNHRIYAGADCRFSTGRKGSIADLSDGTAVADAVIPGYADLGLYLELATARALSFWMRGGNLLNMTIQHNPLYAEKGINFTVGICLNL